MLYTFYGDGIGISIINNIIKKRYTPNAKLILEKNRDFGLFFIYQDNNIGIVNGLFNSQNFDNNIFLSFYNNVLYKLEIKGNLIEFSYKGIIIKDIECFGLSEFYQETNRLD